jgi:hypothetical protein
VSSSSIDGYTRRENRRIPPNSPLNSTCECLCSAPAPLTLTAPSSRPTGHMTKVVISARACRAQPDESKRAFPELVTGDHLSTPAPLHVLVHTQLTPTLRPHDPTTTASTRPAAPADNESRSDNSPPTQHHSPRCWLSIAATRPHNRLPELSYRPPRASLLPRAYTPTHTKTPERLCKMSSPKRRIETDVGHSRCGVSVETKARANHGFLRGE